MKYIATLGLLVLSIPVFARSKSMPCWMVEVRKEVSKSESIRGTGYLLRYGDRTFVRTASHVTLGTVGGVTLRDCRGRSFDLRNADFVTHNMLDDQIIQVHLSDLPVLGIFNPRLELFLVPTDVFDELQANSRRVEVDAMGEDTFVSPPWIKRKSFAFKAFPRNPFLRTLGHSPIEIQSGQSRATQVDGLRLADVSIIPGESGSPLIGWTPAGSLEQKDLSLSMNVERARREGFVDLQGKMVQPALNARTGSVAYVKGHVLGYHLSFMLSKFLSGETFARLHELYEQGRRFDVSRTSWRSSNGNPFRVFEANDLLIKEMNDRSRPSGDGTAGHGGDGTAGHGGDGTAGHGGDGKPEAVAFGMPYNDDIAIAFLNQKGEAFTANWYNFMFLNSGAKIRPVFKTEMAGYLKSRLELTNPNLAPHLSCAVSAKKLSEKRIHVTLRLGYMKTDEQLVYDSGVQDFRALATLFTKSKARVDVDFSGLFGVDLSFVSPQYDPQYGQIPRVLLRLEGFATEQVQCGIL